MSFAFNNPSFSASNETKDLSKEALTSEQWKRTVDKVAKDVNTKEDPIDFMNVISAVQAMRHWRGLSTQRRKVQLSRAAKAFQDSEIYKSDSILSNQVFLERDTHDGKTTHQTHAKDRMQRDQDSAIINYFCKISSAQTQEDNIDLEYIAMLLENGASINARDAYGQTVLHEVARTWHTDIAAYLISCGADVNAQDYQKRTPLHVAAAVDYQEMCQVLINHKADKEAETEAKQTPIFMAAKNDATSALRCLIRNGCNMNALDYRGRTPLYAAAELDRSETALVLVDKEADAFVTDNTGQIAFVPMVEKMPSVAKKAIEQLHLTSRAQRQQQFRLFNLDPLEPNVDSIEKREFFTAIKRITSHHVQPLICHQVIQTYVNLQWHCFARIRVIREIILQIILIGLWTAFAVIKEWTQRYYYDLSSSQEWYRILILVLGVLLTGYNIGDEVREFIGEKRRHQRWMDLKCRLIDDDIKHCHDRWPEEKKYLQNERKAVKDGRVSYFSDWWNYLDWACYIILLASIISHFIDVGYPGGKGNLTAARWHVRIMAVNIVLLWLRLLKYVRPFEFFGPFIVMLGLIISDVVKFFLLYIEFFAPFACAFWIIMGGEKNLPESAVAKYSTFEEYTLNTNGSDAVTVSDFGQFHDMMFQLFRLTLVDEYDYANMMKIDNVTCQILLGAWFAVSTILFINLFIAQLSETFKAVYDNAKAAASMQKAITIVAYYDSMMTRYKLQFHELLKNEYNPRRMTYDDDATEDTSQEELSKATLQMRDTLTELKAKFDRLYELELEEDAERLEDATGGNGMQPSSTEQKATRTKKIAEDHSRAIEAVRNDQAKMEGEMSLLRADVKAMKSLLQDIAIVIAGGASDDNDEDEDEGGEAGRSRSKKSRRRSKRKRREASEELPTEMNNARVINVEPSLPRPPVHNLRNDFSR